MRESSPALSRYTEVNTSRGISRSFKSTAHKKNRRSTHAYGNDYQDILPRFTNQDLGNGSANESNLQIGQQGGKGKFYQEFLVKFKKVSRRPKIEVPADFKDEINLIEKQKIVSGDQRFRLLEIKEKNGLEQLENYNENVSFGKLRKRFLRILR